VNPEEAAALLTGGGLLLAMTAGLIAVVIPIVCYWKIIGKTGHPAPLALAFLVPVAGIVLLYWLAFSDWPAFQRNRGGPPVPVPPPPAPVPSPIPEAGVPSERTAAPAFRFCTGCGMGLEGTERFCASCGKPVNP
jgi:hypothetical protein